MRFPYTKIPSKDPNYPFFLRPYIPLILFKEARQVSGIVGHIDTGADEILINNAWAKALGIDWSKGIRAQTKGIAGGFEKTYLHEIGIEINGLPNSRKLVRVALINSPNVGVLLGQIGFFDNFKVSFERFSGFFDVEPKL